MNRAVPSNGVFRQRLQPGPPGLRKVKQVLVICTIEGSAWFLLPLLHRAGLAIDVVTAAPLLRHSRFVRKVHLACAPDVAATAAGIARCERYDWTIVTEDGLLGQIARLPLPVGERMALLPLAHAEGLSHLHSKVGLAQALERQGIRSPAFAVARTMDEACRAARHIGFPLLLKMDASSGGNGTFICTNADQLAGMAGLFDGRPLLVQKWIAGRKFDADPLYVDGRLARTAIAYTEASIHRFGVSKVRRYLPPALVTDAMLEELDRVGRALHAHGFANVTAIEDAAGNRHYFEADLRPNVWADHGRFIGCDMAEAIRAWAERRTLPQPQGSGPGLRPISMPHVARMSPADLLCRPWQAWRYRPDGDAWLVFLLAARHAIPATIRRLM